MPNHLAAWIAFAAVLFSGCSALQVTEFTGPKTAAKGEVEGGWGLSFEPNVADRFLTEERALNRGFVPSWTVVGRYGIADRIEVTGQAWSATILQSAASLAGGSFHGDLGIRTGIRFCAVCDTGRFKLSVGLSGLAYGAHRIPIKPDLFDTIEYGTSGWVLGVVPTVVAGTERLYLGARLPVYNIDYVYRLYLPWEGRFEEEGREVTETIYGFAPFAGLTTSSSLRFEVAGLMVTTPSGSIAGTVVLGLGMEF